MEERLIIDWENLPTYNTIMSLLTGVSLVSIAKTGKDLFSNKVNPKGWAINFGIIGIILTLTGAHMTLTWPLGKYFPFDNILFGEPTLALGVVNLFLAFYFWKQSSQLEEAENPAAIIFKTLTPLKIMFYALALMQVSIFFSGIDFQFFAAPKEEPISGNFADYPWLESWGLSLIYVGIGASSFATGHYLNRFEKGKAEMTVVEKLNYVALLLTGWFLLAFGAMNYYTHIGLILNTMK